MAPIAPIYLRGSGHFRMGTT